ncbi:hypothetical protein AN217_15550 [Streptomyces qinglanensis]|uniref:Uncharacterized protein n=1 Tax=Streptomyces qinglanensis TaxID=943816 RepID=A0A1E7K517_9ACTN|nr:hypothetical protein AN217_15550 [Streptomyces qinglanensis]
MLVQSAVAPALGRRAPDDSFEGAVSGVGELSRPGRVLVVGRDRFRPFPHRGRRRRVAAHQARGEDLVAADGELGFARGEGA